MKKINSDVFTKIFNQDEKEKIFSDISKYKTEILVKTLEPDSVLNYLKAYDYVYPYLFVLPKNELHLFDKENLKSKDFLKSKNQTLVIIQFSISGDKYFSQCALEIEPIKNDFLFKLNTTSPVYQLQRRENFRIKIPSSYKMQFEFIATDNIFNIDRFEKNNVIDFSAGGCKLHIRESHYLKPNTEIQGILHIPEHENISSKVRICYVQNDPTKKNYQFIGVQFVEMTEIQKNKLAALVMDLYREFFT